MSADRQQGSVEAEAETSNPWAMVTIVGIIGVTIMVCCGAGAYVIVNFPW